MGFTINDKNLRRAALDYFDLSKVFIHDNLNGFLSENTGIIDVYELMLNLTGDVENQRGTILYNNSFSRAEIGNKYVTVFNNRNEKVKTSKIGLGRKF